MTVNTSSTTPTPTQQPFGSVLYRLENMDEPKVIALAPYLFRVWIYLLVVQWKNSGSLPPIEQLVPAFNLEARRHFRRKRLQFCLEELRNGGFISSTGGVLQTGDEGWVP